MTLAQINALKALTYDELAREAEHRGLGPTDFMTPDSLRLAIIDRIVEEELGRDDDRPSFGLPKPIPLPEDD